MRGIVASRVERFFLTLSKIAAQTSSYVDARLARCVFVDDDDHRNACERGTVRDDANDARGERERATIAALGGVESHGHDVRWGGEHSSTTAARAE